jgi:hypothetical protein
MILDADLLKEEATAVAESTTIGNVRHERHACDLGTAEIRPTQSVPVSGTSTFFSLELVGMDHEGNGIVIVDVMLGFREALKRLLGFFEAILANEVPRRFGCKIGSETQWDWPDPLTTMSQQHRTPTQTQLPVIGRCMLYKELIPAMQTGCDIPISLGCLPARSRSGR